MKFINKIALGVALLLTASIQAQEVIPPLLSQGEPEVFKRRKVDGIVATVGDYIILDSDIDKALLEIQAGGNSVVDFTRCQLLGKLMEDKLYAHQAIQDSLIVTDGQVRERMSRQIDYMVEQLGTMDKVVEYFKKESEDDFRTDMFEIIKMDMLSKQMTDKIINEVEITPEEVRTFFNRIPKEELPVFGAELEVAQIVVYPKVSEAEKKRAIDRLKEIKADVEGGASFYGKAVLYTDDKASSPTGGFYKINRKAPFVKEFKDVAFSLGEGEISEPFETEFGYHIIMVEKIRGQDIELRHILITPKVTEEALRDAKTEIELIRSRILENKITFEEAARTLSEEKETKANGGVLINPRTQDTRFELTKMDPQLYRDISNLRDREVSLPILEQDPTGKRKYKIMTVTNRYDEHTADYALDYTKIKALALREKQIIAIGKWFDEKIKDTFVKINGEYRDCDFTNNWLKQ